MGCVVVFVSSFLVGDGVFLCWVCLFVVVSHVCSFVCLLCCRLCLIVLFVCKRVLLL